MTNPEMFYWHPLRGSIVVEWLMAIALVSGFSSFAFYLGTRWGRYTDDDFPLRRDDLRKEDAASWERTRRPSNGFDTRER
jgi:hypothetical protein